MEVQTIETDARGFTAEELYTKLRYLNSCKVDAVVPATKMQVTTDGSLIYTDADGNDRRFTISDQFVGQMASKLGIPKRYLEKCRDQMPYLFANNSNAWLRHIGKSYLVRAYSNGESKARALLSPNYRVMDNIDVLAGCMEAVNKMGVRVEVEKSDLTENSLYLRLRATEIMLDVEHILAHYAERFSAAHTGYGTEALQRFVSPAIVIRNDECGGAALSARPHVKVLVCRNNLMDEVDAFRKVHLGGRMDEGDIQWGDDTRRANRDLIISQFSDAIKLFLNQEWLQGKVNSWRNLVETPVENPATVTQNVSFACGFNDDQRDAIFREFINVGDHSHFGVVGAITFVAQQQRTGYGQYEMENAAASIIPDIAKYDVPETISNN